MEVVRWEPWKVLDYTALLKNKTKCGGPRKGCRGLEDLLLGNTLDE